MLDHAHEDWDEARDREAADLEAERARAALTADWRYCPTCDQPTLPDRHGTCLFCLGQTTSLPASAGQTGPSGSPVACTVPTRPRHAPWGARRRGARGQTMKFIAVLWSGRQRPVNPHMQERVAQAAVRTAWDVKATPVKPPVKERRPHA